MSQDLTTVKEKAKQMAKSMPGRGDSQNDLDNHPGIPLAAVWRTHIVEGKGEQRDHSNNQLEEKIKHQE